ncbi:hypothetical protein TWF106_002013 [Orbilia oligospora]|uniref:PUM-HD domain-containing protein n=1 Tax=Orbilia oligospora TaxID=2813651 RepID=A0A6G1LSN6_ORBOL|nr:hypothetical protein TWF788_002773 [Orbilia oligospora]KAF3197485.1 hypothetical protein TWF679_003164 [Orbilia oligospora]KAF3203329.1 hypothetical protein TWF106_002013 [Orbilia oligospora]KAF3228296.1 hypothetical protein TWF191_002801 [Orbilia oligospora]KAF3230957.1 hypothetical protein TWF192_003872 [Orbilia oligospora]
MTLSPTSGYIQSERKLFGPAMNDPKFGHYGHEAPTSADSSPITSPGAARTTLHRRFTSETIRPTYPQAPMVPQTLGPPTLVPASILPPTLGNPIPYNVPTDVRAISNDEKHRQLQNEQRDLAHQIQKLQLLSQQNELALRGLSIQDSTGSVFQGARNFGEPTTPPEHDYMYGSGYGNKANGGSFKSGDGKTGANYQLMTPPADDIIPSMSSSRNVSDQRRDTEDGKRSAHWGGSAKQRGVLPFLDSSPILGVSDRKGFSNLGALNQGSFGFESTPGPLPSRDALASSPSDSTQVFQMNTATDDFPVLLRRDDLASKRTVSSSKAMEAIHGSGIKTSEDSQGWPSFPRHRPGQQSLPANTLPFNPSSTFSSKYQVSPAESVGTYHQDDLFLAQKKAVATLEDEGFGNLSSLAASTHGLNSMAPKLQSSLSTSDIPTVRTFNFNAASPNAGKPVLGGAGRRDSATDFGVTGTPFGPPLYNVGHSHSPISPVGMSPLPSPRFPTYNQMSIANKIYAVPTNQFHGLGQVSAPAKTTDFFHPTSPGRGHSRRGFESDGNRFSNLDIEALGNEIYLLCKDQHGCRFLQRKLEEQNPKDIEIIFRETQAFIVELMTDPFGNYLCQKLLEHTNNEQRSKLVNNAAPHLVEIALNQHGTRALQKMIEFLSTPDQIQTVINALRGKVVELIQDLNGNHVIQKCLNRLKPEDAQFIFDAVGKNCVTVGTHRHGCCVLQRCIDHASTPQRAELIAHITENAFALVRDPFGNYVVQYILDLGEPELAEPMIHKFLGRIIELSMQKFSSNVIEKCIRVSSKETRALMVKEIVNPPELEKLIRDSYANYVIQTALDYAEADSRAMLVDNLRPIMPSIRMTPYGRRIQSKIQALSGMSPDGLGAVFETSYRLGPIPPLQTQPRMPSATYGHYTPQVSRSHNIPNQSGFPIAYQPDMVSNNFIL